MSGFLLRAIAFYQRAISPALPPRCRFFPSCSAYAAEAVTVHGAARGSWLAVRRILKCAPWHRGGVDLVPPARPLSPRATSPRATPPRATTPRATPPAPSRAPQEESSVA